MATRCNYNKDICTRAKAAFNQDNWLQCKDPAGHLFDNLTWLLRAAQEWQIQSELKLQLDGYSAQVYVMDSVFLRARSLFEFFTGKGSNYCHARCLFNLDDQLVYPAYSVHVATSCKNLWAHALHVGSLHLQDRGGHLPLTGYDGISQNELNKMPADIAKGILDVWRNFELALQSKGHTDLHRKAVDCRRQAAKDARNVVESVYKRGDAYTKARNQPVALTVLFKDQEI